MWLTTLFILHNLIVRIEEKNRVVEPGIWGDLDEENDGGDGDGDSDSDDDNDHHYDQGDDEGGDGTDGVGMDDDDHLSPGKAFRLHLYRILDQKGLLN
jgi:hypothetical protein